MSDDIASTEKGANPSRVPTESYIRERFDLGDPIYSTRGAEAREGVDREGMVEVTFWLLRYPLVSGSSSENEFIERLNSFSRLIAAGSLRGKAANLRDFGVTDSGLAYFVTQFIPGDTLNHFSSPVEKRLEVFQRMVETIAVLHREGLCCGDLSPESFVIRDGDRPVLVSLGGSFEGSSRSTVALPPPDTLVYLAPEQRLGGNASKSADIFALGLLGYRLLTGNSPIGDKNPALAGSVDELLNTTPPPTSIQRGLPIWIDEVLGRCLEEFPDSRFADADALLQSILASQESGYAVDGGGRWAKRTVMIKPRTDAVLLTSTPLKSGEEREVTTLEQPKVEKKSAPAVGAGRLLLAGAALAAGIIAATIMFLYSEGSRNSEQDLSLSEFGPPELAPLLHDLRADGVSPEQKIAALKQLSESTYPASFSFLAQSLRGKLPAEVKKEGIGLLSQKIEREGLLFTSKVVARWLAAVVSAEQDPLQMGNFLVISRACDQNVPLDARRDALHKGFADDPRFSLELTAALALDDGKQDRFSAVLRQLLIQAGTGGDLSGRGAGALILANKGLTAAFQRELVKALQNFSSADLAWSMIKLAESDSPLVFDLTQEVIRRKIVPPYQEVFLNSLATADGITLPRSVKVALAKAAQGQIGETEVIALASWQDIKREDSLLAVCAISPSPEIAQSALEALAARAVVSEPATKLIEWVQKYHWDSRGAIAKAIGVLGHLDLAKDTEVNFAFEQLMPFTADGEFLRAVMKTGKGRLLREAVKRTSVITDSDTLVALAEPEQKFDSEVRIVALNALKERNDVKVLSQIKSMYSRETDANVRSVYRTNFWVIAEGER